MNAAAAPQVSSAPAAPATPARFIDNGDGTISEPARGLMWSKATLCDREVDHATALRLCGEFSGGGHTDWRAPTVEEFFPLSDRSRHSPAIDVEAFPDTRSDWYWTSTIAAWSSDRAWIVFFSYGSAANFHRVNRYGFVRAVRRVSAGQ